MKECLNCKKEYESKRNTSKFCCTSCRVRYHQLHGKQQKNQVTPLQMQVLYDSMLELIEKAKSEPMQPNFGIMTQDEVMKWGETLNKPVKIMIGHSEEPPSNEQKNNSGKIISDWKQQLLELRKNKNTKK